MSPDQSKLTYFKLLQLGYTSHLKPSMITYIMPNNYNVFCAIDTEANY